MSLEIRLKCGDAGAVGLEWVAIRLQFVPSHSQVSLEMTKENPMSSSPPKSTTFCRDSSYAIA